eukprot:RCo026312
MNPQEVFSLLTQDLQKKQTRDFSGSQSNPGPQIIEVVNRNGVRGVNAAIKVAVVLLRKHRERLQEVLFVLRVRRYWKWHCKARLIQRHFRRYLHLRTVWVVAHVHYWKAVEAQHTANAPFRRPSVVSEGAITPGRTQALAP